MKFIILAFISTCSMNLPTRYSQRIFFSESSFQATGIARSLCPEALMNPPPGRPSSAPCLSIQTMSSNSFILPSCCFLVYYRLPTEPMLWSSFLHPQIDGRLGPHTSLAYSLRLYLLLTVSGILRRLCLQRCSTCSALTDAAAACWSTPRILCFGTSNVSSAGTQC